MAEPSLSISVILATFTDAEIDENITRLKDELKDLHKSISGNGKAGERSMEAVRGDLESFGQAKVTRLGRGGIIQTQATFRTGPEADRAFGPRWESGSGI